MSLASRRDDIPLFGRSSHAIIDTLRAGVPDPLTELITLGRMLTSRAVDVLAYFDRPGTSNGPTEAINGRLEHLRGSTLGFRDLSDYITSSLLENDPKRGFLERLGKRHSSQK